MKILLMTNTYLPHVGGVAKSVEAFACEYRRVGHDVLIIAPEFPDMPPVEKDVVRVPAMRRFNHSDFSVRLPIPAHMQDAVNSFKPDIIHSQHPFLLGASAMRLASGNGIPIVFTHHTMYEQYTHYFPGDSDILRRTVAEIATGYANLCHQVFAPSESLAAIIRERGVTAPVDVVPTGVPLEQFERGDGAGLRAVLGIPANAFLIGHVGRLTPEKNLEFLAESVASFMRTHADAHFLVVGSGPSLEAIQQLFRRAEIDDRLHTPGALTGPFLVSAYKAMDAFAFASQTETQGMVLTEAMAASTPVIAVDATGVRDVVTDGENGFLLSTESELEFVAALDRYRAQSPTARKRMQQAAAETARAYSLEASAQKALRLYQRTIQAGYAHKSEEDSPWSLALDRIRTEWELIANTAGAFGSAVMSSARGADSPA